MTKEQAPKTREELEKAHREWRADLERRAEEAANNPAGEAENKPKGPVIEQTDHENSAQAEFLKRYLEEQVGEKEKGGEKISQQLEALKKDGWKLVDTIQNAAKVSIENLPPGEEGIILGTGTTRYVLKRKKPSQDGPREN